jgi:hypothetical protein
MRHCINRGHAGELLALTNHREILFVYDWNRQDLYTIAAIILQKQFFVLERDCGEEGVELK